MKDKYNQIRLAQYSQALAQRLSEEHFAHHENVTAQQLISFTPIKQVNLYMIRELLTLWNHEMANLRSPYFDFEHPEVKDALVQFMNVLSRKISIKRPHFEPLLLKAIQDTLRCVLEPVAVFEEKFMRMDDLTVPKLQDSLKYQDLDKDVYRQFLDHLASDSSFDRHQVIPKLNRFLAEHETERISVDELVGRFNELQPLRVEDLFPVVAAPAPAPMPAVSTHVASPQPSFRPTLHAEPKLNERYTIEQKPTLNERLKQPANTNFVDRNQEQKIGSLKEAISINQRFSFINELFEGDNMAYHAVIKQLDEYQSPDQAKQYLVQEVGSKYNWSKKEDHVQKLTRLIERKFA
ncbi:hypothetical protein ACD591_00655 [Rufibacter glacialis]|uniref:Uncharacterized protein n=1 Tax=Rufibacter glacialis TaxID=1259555 RepID=A0A5M8QK98_9BACT|nr:hypothetical protein [Rufibacter glacialis]KAA6435420.1 hypothetical protein FOE74_05565 [Rufibacter glacialis]GGK63261.1 hypothetical protein GCM10011405_09140 [Rufibacter glacialis]